MKLRILLTGANGQLGWELQQPVYSRLAGYEDMNDDGTAHPRRKCCRCGRLI